MLESTLNRSRIEHDLNAGRARSAIDVDKLQPLVIETDYHRDNRNHSFDLAAALLVLIQSESRHVCALTTTKA
jgi:hypothetical protein